MTQRKEKQMVASRPIRFRAWDEGEKEMVTNLFDRAIINKQGNLIAQSALRLMQYTGLKDKNGKEIYEGDVVRYDESEKISHWVAGETAVVVWVAPRFTFRMKPYDEFSGSNQNMPSEDDSEFLEIIGNIYENPELLNS